MDDTTHAESTTSDLVTITIQLPSTAPGLLLERVSDLADALGAEGGVDQILIELIRTCIVCGCTDEQACFGGCWWVSEASESERDLCSSCANANTETQ